MMIIIIIIIINNNIIIIIINITDCVSVVCAQSLCVLKRLKTH